MATPGHSKASRIYFDGFRLSQVVSGGDQTVTADAVEVPTLENDYKTFLQGKAMLASNWNGFLTIDDGGWDAQAFAAINDGGHVITVSPVGITGESIAYPTRQFSTGESQAYDQANIVLLNWSGQNEDNNDFGRGTIITTGEKAFTGAASDSGDEVGAAAATVTTVIALHCVSWAGLTDMDIQIEESSDDAGADAYAQVTGWSIEAEGNATAGTDEVVFTGTGAAYLKVTKAVEAWLRITCSDSTGVGSASFIAAHAVAAGV